MDASAVAAAGPGYHTGIASRSTHRSSPVCRCCGQRLLLYRRAPAASTGGTSMKNMTRAKKMTDGWLSSRSGGEICCAGAYERTLNQSFKKETCQRLMTGIVVYGLGRAFEACSSSSAPQTSGRGIWGADVGMGFAKPSAAEKRFFGGADDLRGESNGGGFRAGRRAGDAYSSFSRLDGGNEGISLSTQENYLWQDSSRRNEVEGFHSIADGRSSGGTRAADSLELSTGREREGGAQRMAMGSAERQGENWDLWGGQGATKVRTHEPRHASSAIPSTKSTKTKVRTHEPRYAASAIPSSELAKIEELRFSGDMQEGDAGPQVLNLQRALFWLGHLRGLSLTGYFGPETARALREFHYAHGMPSSGAWGFASRQVLWEHLHPEESRTQSAKQSNEELTGSSQLERTRPHFGLVEAWLLIKDFSDKAKDGAGRVSHTVKQWQSNARTELLASVSAGTHPALGSRRVGTLFFAGVVVLSSIIMLVRLWSARPQGQPVKRRIMSLRNDVESIRGLRQTTPRAYRGSQVRSNGETNSRHGLHTSNTSDLYPGTVLDRLVFFDGQVVQGDQYFGNGKSGTRSETNSSHVNEGNLDELPNWGVALGESSDQFRPPGSFAETQRNYGFGEFRKPEMDPPRRSFLYNQSPTHIGKALGGSSSEMQLNLSQEEQSSHSPLGWAGWVSLLFPGTLTEKERFHASRKGRSRRIVSGVAASKRSKSSENGAARGVGQPYRFESERQRRNAQNELELKQKVEDLHRTVQSVEQTRVAAVQALKEEKMHNLALETKMRHQKEAAAALEEELRVLKDSHEALLATLRKKYSSSAAARAAAALLYQNWDPSGSGARV